MLAALAALFVKPKKVEAFSTRPWIAHLHNESRANRLPVKVALSLVVQESGGDENARGSSGEVGLLQLKNVVLQDYERVTRLDADINKPVDNITVGLWYLGWLRDRFTSGNLHDALLMYNSGIGNFRSGRIQNAKYASQVLNRAETIV